MTRRTFAKWHCDYLSHMLFYRSGKDVIHREGNAVLIMWNMHKKKYRNESIQHQSYTE